MSFYEINNNVPVPAIAPKTANKLFASMVEKLDVGQSFEFPVKPGKRSFGLAVAAKRRAAEKLNPNKQFIVEATGEDKAGIWRVK